MHPYEKVHVDTLGKHKRHPLSMSEQDTGREQQEEDDKIIFLSA